MKKRFYDFWLVTGIWISSDMTGKMEGFSSLSTACTNNPYCMERAKDPESICHECYAGQLLNFRDAMKEHLEENTRVLSSELLPVNDWITLNALYFRLESFGDVVPVNNGGITQVNNYFNFARKNPKTTFTAWTKNPAVYKAAIAQGAEKPENFILVYSSPYMDRPADNSILEKYPFIDVIFTVWTAAAALENNISINCGMLKCINCLRCYTKHNGVIYINEILKCQSKRYYKELAKRNAK